MGKTKTVGKDREGVYHPPKGKPSGVGKAEGLGLQATDPDKMDQYLDITDKYIVNDDDLADNVTMRHPNRNVNKRNDALRETSFKNKQQDAESAKSKNETFTEPLTDTVAEELPEILSKDVLASLQAITGECCITIYLRTHKAGMEVNEGQDAIRFKNMLQDATQQLAVRGYSEGYSKRWLKPAYDLYRNDEFWKQQNEGLALFISDDFCRYIRMKRPTQERIYINHHFALAPLARLMVNSQYFYLLLVSKRRAKLFRADDYGMAYVPVEKLTDPDHAAPWEEGAGQLNDQSMYGISGSKTDTATYLKQVHDALKEAILKTEHAPLLLAGVESVASIYRSINDYPYLWHDVLTGNHEYDNTDSLYREAREIMQPYFNQRLSRALDLWHNQSATPLTSVNLSEIIPATHYGAVSHLFVVDSEQLWGHFDEVKNELKLTPDNEGQQEDLIDRAVTQAILTGAEVFFLERAQMPERSAMAAILRYEQT